MARPRRPSSSGTRRRVSPTSAASTARELSTPARAAPAGRPGGSRRIAGFGASTLAQPNPEIAEPATGRQKRPFSAAGALAAGLVGCAVLAANTAARRADVDFADMAVYRRLWSDFAVATWRYLDGRLLGAPGAPGPGAQDPTAAYRAIVLEKAATDGIRPWQFWRTLRPQPFARERGHPQVGEFDDQGRAILLGLGFWVLRGISPFLILWLGALVAMPVLAWSSWELFAAGEPAAGVAFPVLVACSCFVVDVLSLPRSAVGFYVAGLLLLVPMAMYAILGRSRSRRGFWLRVAGAAVAFGVCAVCRSGTLFLFPALAASVVLAARRLGPPLAARARGRGAAIAAALLLLVLPYLVWRQPQRHETWASMWAG